MSKEMAIKAAKAGTFAFAGVAASQMLTKERGNAIKVGAGIVGAAVGLVVAWKTGIVAG